MQTTTDQRPTNPITGQPYSKYYKPGAQNGSSFYWWSGQTLIIEPRSHTSRESRYRIEANTRTGLITCSCEAFRFARNAENPQPICKHIFAEADWIADELRTRLESGDAISTKGSIHHMSASEAFGVTR